MNDDVTCLFGRELDLPDTAVTVRVRAGERTVSPGPIAPTDAYLTGLDAIECADLDTAVLSLTRSAPGSSPHAVPGRAYLLCGWIGQPTSATVNDRRLITAIESWRQATDARGHYLMGSSFGGVEASVDLRLRDARTLLLDTPFIEVFGECACIDVVLGSGAQPAIEFAAAHPLASTHVIEVRPFRTECCSDRGEAPPPRG